MTLTAFSGNLRSSNYRLLGLVGQGQFGQVYCAIHRKTGRLVALKHLNRDRLPTNRFLRELRFLLSLEHPHIVNCHALEQSTTGRQLVLDYCEGGTLRSIMEQETQLTLAEILTLVIQILQALEHAHSQQVVHCDIKPENIVLILTPDGWQAKVSDFGIARLSQEYISDQTGGTGSPAYMAPERFYHQHAAASDLYAVGIILFELLVGDRPFAGNHTQLMVAHLNHAVRIPDTLPPSIQSLLQTSLEKLVGRRFRSAAAMKTAVLSACQTLPPSELQARFPKPVVAVYVSSFTPQIDMPLAAPCQALEIEAGGEASPPQLFAAMGSTVSSWSLATNLASVSPSATRQWQLDGVVRQLFNTSNGVIATTDQTLYCLTDQGSQPIATFPDPIDVAPGHHRWMMVQAITIPNRFWLVDSQAKLPTSPRSFTVDQPEGTVQSLFLDNRHVVLADVTEQLTHLHVVTRWGKPLGQLNLKTPVHQLVSSCGAYQFLALAGSHRSDLLVIQLKPFRVMRCRLDIEAVWLGELVVGFVGISQAGQLRIVNFQGQLIGHLDHLPRPSAIAFQPPYHLWLATSQGRSPRLHYIDIRKLDLDIIF